LRQRAFRIPTSASWLTILNWFSTDKKGDRDRDGIDDRAEGAGLGGAAGLLAGLGLLAVPGLGGPVVAAGWLAATLSVLQPVLPREGLWKL
jgi:hypothetical protein